ncbi:hypothetical protein NRK67_12760 [Fusobacteria bacterium ZRK30]|nr:hypothetical protein NRK67_12760 [Fusobacteria bacterium ZRK30]
MTLLKPLEVVTVEEMDIIKSKIHRNLLKIAPVRTEVIFTQKRWYQ